MYFVGNKTLLLELRNTCRFILKANGTTLQSIKITLSLNIVVNSVIVGTFSGHLVLPHYGTLLRFKFSN